MQTTHTCQFCGANMPAKAGKCPACDTPVRRHKNRTVAAVLAFTGGGLGLHRFYLGQWWGLFYLLLFWTGLPFLVGFIEAGVFGFTSEEHWHARHNRYSPDGRVGPGTIALILASCCVIPVCLAVLIILTVRLLQSIHMGGY